MPFDPRIQGQRQSKHSPIMPLEESESLIATRSRRSNAGSRLKSLLQAEEILNYDEDDENVDLLFQENESDDEFSLNDESNDEEDGEVEEVEGDDNEEMEENENRDDKEKEGRIGTGNNQQPRGTKRQLEHENDGEYDSDQVFSDSDESSSEEEQDTGEKELQKQERLKKRKDAKKKHASFKINGPKKESLTNKKQKKSLDDRVSADSLMSETRRSSTRRSAVQNKIELVNKLKESEKRKASMKPRLQKEVHIMTQEERLLEAVETERQNVLSLTQFREQEIIKKQKRSQMMSAKKELVNVVRFFSNIHYVTAEEEAEELRILKIQNKKKDKRGRKSEKQKQIELDELKAEEEFRKLQERGRLIELGKTLTEIEEIERNREAEMLRRREEEEAAKLKKEQEEEAAKLKKEQEEEATKLNKEQEQVEGKGKDNTVKTEDIAEENDAKDEGNGNQVDFKDQKNIPIHPEAENFMGDKDHSMMVDTESRENKNKEDAGLDKENDEAMLDEKEKDVNMAAEDLKDGTSKMLDEKIKSEEHDEKSDACLEEEKLLEANTSTEVKASDTKHEPIEISKETETEKGAVDDRGELDNEKKVSFADNILTNLPELEPRKHEGPALKVFRDYLILENFEDPKELSNPKEVKLMILGPQSLWPAQRRSNKVERIIHIKSSSATDSQLVTTSKSDLFIPYAELKHSEFEELAKFPRLGVTEDIGKLDNENDTKEEAVKEININTPAPSSIYLPSGQRKTCFITGKPALYFEPRTGIPYNSVEAYKVIDRIKQGEFSWCTFEDGKGAYVFARHGEPRAAKGVPPGFLD
ncbi:Vps72 protein [Saccharomycopsis crataegensis]|uniref:Vps72 protein n=1 Tax=Saccharomycopsis crataegensis TaxID=43959 RepID=A0AAV5QKA8_9ASCO|nr:Vps72 protein [Saccharomycopsis crataegensis]